MKIKRPVRRKNTRTVPIIAGGLLVVVLVAVYYLYLFNTTDAPEAPAGDPSGQQALPPDNVSGYLILSDQTDLNADGTGETLLIRQQPGIVPDRSLQQDGYTRAVSHLLIKQGERTLLWINPLHMARGDGQLLLDQEEATYGYGIRLETYTDDAHYTAPVQLIHLVLLDETGQANSDEITLYWKPSEQRYAATNTFGAEGTF